MTSVPAEQLPLGIGQGPNRTPALTRQRSRSMQRAREFIIRALLISCATFSVLTTFAIIFILLGETWRFFSMPEVSVKEFFTGTEWKPLLGSTKHFGIWPLVTGTMLVTGI